MRQLEYDHTTAIVRDQKWFDTLDVEKKKVCPLPIRATLGVCEIVYIDVCP